MVSILRWRGLIYWGKLYGRGSCEGVEGLHRALPFQRMTISCSTQHTGHLLPREYLRGVLMVMVYSYHQREDWRG